MRRLCSALGLGCLILLGGCRNLKEQGNAYPAAAGPRFTNNNPTALELVNYLNENARRIQTMEFKDVDLDCSQGIQSVHLRGQMACQKPRNFRMQIQAMGSTAGDLGSNDQEFWFWIGKNDPPYLFHCSYQDFDRGNVRMPFPFQPDWIIEALGLGEYKPDKKYQVVSRGKAVDLIEPVLTAGRPGQKITVFTRNGNIGHVSQYVLLDANGKEVCTAHITQVQQDRTTGAVVPREIQLICTGDKPSERVKMKMKLDGLTVNRQIGQEQSARLFTRPVLQNVQSYDMARGSLDGYSSSVRPAGGFSADR